MTDACPFCGSLERKPLYRGMRDRLGLWKDEFTVLSCQGCGTAMLERVPSPEELAGLYPPEYIIKDDRRGPLMDLWAKAEILLFYDRMYALHARHFMKLTGLRAGRLLEVGCGNGRRMAEFARAGFEVEGVETSRVDVDYASGRLGCRARCGTLETLDFEPGAYDAVIFYNVFEHLPDPVESAAKVYEILKPGGIIFVYVPVMDGLQAAILGRRWIEVAEMPRHIFIPGTRGMMGLLAKTGFTGCRAAPVSVFNLANTIAASLAPGAVGADAYRGGKLSALMNRAAGAVVMLLSMPFALAERLSGRTSAKVFWARKPGP